MIVNPPYKITLQCMGSATRDLATYCSLIISLPYVGLICGATYKCQGICNTKKITFQVLSSQPGSFLLCHCTVVFLTFYM